MPSVKQITIDSLAVIIPVCNRFSFLYRALLCLKHQSVLPAQVIISDDGSDENMLGELQRVRSEFDFDFRYVRQEKKGFRAARVRNNAVRLTQCELLIFLDQDILYTENFIKTFVDFAQPGRFNVGWAVYLTPEQTDQLQEEMIFAGDYAQILTPQNIGEYKHQYRKDLFYSFLKKMRLRRIGPKLRAGLFSLFRDDFYKVNGFDERYIDGGHEDDDLGRRLHAAGVTGKNPFKKDVSLHMFHPPNRTGNVAKNREYYLQQIPRINRGEYYCTYGVNNALDLEELVYTDL